MGINNKEFLVVWIHNKGILIVRIHNHGILAVRIHNKGILVVRIHNKEKKSFLWEFHNERIQTRQRRRVCAAANCDSQLRRFAATQTTLATAKI